MTRKRVVITGLGSVCALGPDSDAIWRAMQEGKCGLGPLGFDRRDLKTDLGGEIDSFDDSAIDPKIRPSMARVSDLAVISSAEAMANSALAPGSFNPDRAGAIVGVAVWGSDAVDQAYIDVFLEGKKRANILTVPQAMPGAAAGHVSMHFNLRAPVFGLTSACASSNHAISAAVDQIRLGRADIMLAGGADTPMTYGIVKVWETMRVLARAACRPFSADRDGLVLADGAGIAVLEEYEHAKARGAPILAEVAGCGSSADATDIVSPSVEGPAAAMQACLEEAGLNAADIGYINAHGTGTKANDRIETQAIHSVFGAHAGNLSVSSTKSMHGHALGASGAIELIACVNALNHGVIPPTIGYNTADPECDLDVTPNKAVERKVDAVISNAFAFGGMNSVIALTKV